MAEREQAAAARGPRRQGHGLPQGPWGRLNRLYFWSPGMISGFQYGPLFTRPTLLSRSPSFFLLHVQPGVYISPGYNEAPRGHICLCLCHSFRPPLSLSLSNRPPRCKTHPSFNNSGEITPLLKLCGLEAWPALPRGSAAAVGRFCLTSLPCRPSIDALGACVCPAETSLILRLLVAPTAPPSIRESTPTKRHQTSHLSSNLGLYDPGRVLLSAPPFPHP